MFYHLTDSPLEVTLPLLLAKSLQAGFQVDLRGPDRDRLEALDKQLWQGPEEGFLPHGLAGGPHDAIQPVLLTTATTARKGTNCVMAIDGAEVTPEEPAGLERLCILFADGDAQAKTTAREQWRYLTGAGCTAEYWAQDDGHWTRKMTTEKT